MQDSRVRHRVTDGCRPGSPKPPVERKQGLPSQETIPAASPRKPSSALWSPVFLFILSKFPSFKKIPLLFRSQLALVSGFHC